VGGACAATSRAAERSLEPRIVVDRDRLGGGDEVEREASASAAAAPRVPVIAPAPTVPATRRVLLAAPFAAVEQRAQELLGPDRVAPLLVSAIM